MSDRVVLYDTTLRDGTQREGLVVSAADKIRIARLLDDFGFPYIEGGWPGSNPKDAEFFAAAATMTWRSARIAAFGSTRRKGIAAAADPNLAAILASGTPVATIFGKSWTFQVTKVLEASLHENLEMIADSVNYLAAAGREVIYDAEHYFDGALVDHDYALASLVAAADSGASTLVLCDTRGGALPEQVFSLTDAAARHIEDWATRTGRATPIIGIHAHNDGELAVANSLAALGAGARHVQGTINGYGERCGNANLVSLIADLELKTGFTPVPSGRLAGLTELSRTVAEAVNITPDAHAPYVGHSAFAHKGGVHGAATARAPQAYAHIDPATVGNEARMVVSELAGRANVAAAAAGLGSTLGTVDAASLAALVKDLESGGDSFEGAEASFALLLRRREPGYVAPFVVRGYTVLVEQRNGMAHRAEASIKVEVDGEELHTAAQGNGPVHALDTALRKALCAFYPDLSSVTLVDYHVRILDGSAGTAARTRVAIDMESGSSVWSVMGSGTDVLAASAVALVDGLEYAIWKSGGRRNRPSRRARV